VGTRDDLAASASIQTASPEASQWSPETYLAYGCLVAEVSARVVGFVVTRVTAPDEREILNVAVEPALRGAGIGRILVETVLTTAPGWWFLEVRESNIAAVNLYKTLGFTLEGRRENYYHDPVEVAIVMRVFS
jgi:ribosomal-protein-alanine N-acetyltransferase